MPYLRLIALFVTLLAASAANASVQGDCVAVYDTGSGNCNVSANYAEQCKYLHERLREFHISVHWLTVQVSYNLIKRNMNTYCIIDQGG